MKKSFLLLFIFTSFSSFYTNYSNHFCINEKYDFAELDNLGNLYLVKNDQVKKYNLTGDLIKVFSNKKHGNIYSLDVTNPLRILLFYREQSQIVFLDSQLSENSTSMDLLSLNLEQSDLSCTSFNNGVWLFNRQNNELVRLNSKLDKVVNTGNLNVLLSIKLSPDFMIERESFLYINNPEYGIHVFDIYGSFYKTIPLKNLKKFDVIAGQICYFMDSKLVYYNQKTFETIEKVYDENKLEKVIEINKNKLKFFKDSICFETIH